MNTVERLEAMTDAGKFERLATLVLRKSKSNYEALIQLGINAKNQPIASPNDGFCLIPNSDPAHFLWAQHTITQRAGLRDKWLNENEGDLVKAWQRAQVLQEEFPDAKFTVILSTTQYVPTERSEPNLLVEDVYRKAKELGLTVDIWEQSRYAGFLDASRDGQWLRKEFFGTEAEMLSLDLLVELSQKSLATYKNRQFTNPDNWITRQLVDRISLRRSKEQATVRLLIGESGYGKSAAAYSFLEKHIEFGGAGLFIPEDVIQDSISLEEALRKTLNKLYPNLLSKEVSLIHEFIPSDSRFVIVVDDLNQTANPQALIRRLVNWAKSYSLIICPIWPRFRPLVQDIESKGEVDVISVERMSISEGIRAIETVAKKADIEISKLDAQSIAGRLQYDPLLIGSFGELLSEASHEQIDDLVENIVEAFVERCVGETALDANNRHFKHEYRETLFVLTSHMLKERRLYPTWREIETWLQNSAPHLTRLRDLCDHGKLCRVSGNQFRFHHDRVLYYFSMNRMIVFLDNISENADVLFEPYYADILGQALVKIPQSEAIIDEICNKLPLALVSAIKYIDVPSSEYHKLLVQKVKEWVQYRGSNFSSTPESVRGAVANSFINTDSPTVLDIVNTDFGLEVRWLGDFARFRNGDANSVIGYCSILNGQISGISRYENSWWEDLVDHARRHHRKRLIQDLAQLLEMPDNNNLKGLLVLVGFLALPELHNALTKKWKRMINKSANLLEMLWAAFRCTSDYQENGLLNSLMSYWAVPADVDDSQLLGWQESITSRIGHALAFDADQELINYLIWQSHQYGELRLPLAEICGLIDLPDAIEFALRECAERENEQERCSILSRWSSSSTFGSSSKLSGDSVARLQNIWQAAGNDNLICKMAFQLWLRNVNRSQTDVLELIVTIQPTSPLFAQALWHRALLRDETCVTSLISALESDSHYFCVAWNLWCDEIMEVTERYLEAFAGNMPQDFSGGRQDDHYHVAGMLEVIPQKDAERLLVKHWEHLRYSRLFVQVALFVGTFKCLEMANEVIEEYPDDVNPFEHIDSLIAGFGLESENKPLTLEHFKNLQPYLSYFDDYMLSWYIENCHQFGLEGIEWCKNNLPESIRESYQKQYFPTDNDLLQSLDNLPSHRNSALVWLSQFERYNKPSDRFSPTKWKYSQNPFAILDKWLENEPTYQKLRIVATCIEEIGMREDLRILNVTLEHPWEKYEAERIRENTAFAVCRRTLE